MTKQYESCNRNLQKELKEILRCVSELEPTYGFNRDTSFCFDEEKYAVQLRVFREEDMFGLDIVLQENLNHKISNRETDRNYSDLEWFRVLEADFKNYKKILNEKLISELKITMKKILKDGYAMEKQNAKNKSLEELKQKIKEDPTLDTIKDIKGLAAVPGLEFYERAWLFEYKINNFDNLLVILNDYGNGHYSYLGCVNEMLDKVDPQELDGTENMFQSLKKQ